MIDDIAALSGQSQVIILLCLSYATTICPVWRTSAKFFSDSMSRISFIRPLVPTIQNMNSFLLNFS